MRESGVRRVLSGGPPLLRRTPPFPRTGRSRRRGALVLRAAPWRRTRRLDPLPARRLARVQPRRAAPAAPGLEDPRLGRPRQRVLRARTGRRPLPGTPAGLQVRTEHGSVGPAQRQVCGPGGQREVHHRLPAVRRGVPRGVHRPDGAAGGRARPVHPERPAVRERARAHPVRGVRRPLLLRPGRAARARRRRSAGPARPGRPGPVLPRPLLGDPARVPDAAPRSPCRRRPGRPPVHRGEGAALLQRRRGLPRPRHPHRRAGRPQGGAAVRRSGRRRGGRRGPAGARTGRPGATGRTGLRTGRPGRVRGRRPPLPGPPVHPRHHPQHRLRPPLPARPAAPVPRTARRTRGLGSGVVRAGRARRRGGARPGHRHQRPAHEQRDGRRGERAHRPARLRGGLPGRRTPPPDRRQPGLRRPARPARRRHRPLRARLPAARPVPAAHHAVRHRPHQGRRPRPGHRPRLPGHRGDAAARGRGDPARHGGARPSGRFRFRTLSCSRLPSRSRARARPRRLAAQP